MNILADFLGKKAISWFVAHTKGPLLMNGKVIADPVVSLIRKMKTS